MTSRAQVEANRKNALASRGPATAAGRARARWNALRHGMEAGQAVLPDEDAGALEELTRATIAELGAEGALEATLAERAALLLWRLRRAGRVEGAMYVLRRAAVERQELVGRWHERRGRASSTGAVLRYHETFAKEEEVEAVAACDAATRAAALGAAFLADAGGENAFARLARHEAALQRALHDTLDELARLQARRAGTEAVAIDGVAEAVEVVEGTAVEGTAVEIADGPEADGLRIAQPQGTA